MLSSRIAIVALNNYIYDKNYSDFIALPAKQKIEQLKTRIINICSHLEKTEPNSKWYIVWREHGITSETGKSVTPEIKHLLESTIQELSLQYPALTIIAGTILTRKKYKASAADQHAEQKAKKIKSYYKDNCQWIKAIEGKLNCPGGIKNEEKVVQEAEINCMNHAFTYYVYRNICLTASAGKIFIQDKITPLNETVYEPSKGFNVFQPGNKYTHQSLYEDVHPVTNVPITYGIEICQEHPAATLMHLHPDKEKPLIHFILSNTTQINLNHIYGYYALQLDSVIESRLLYLDNPENNNLPQFYIVFYQNNLLDENDHTLKGPHKSIYPFEKRVIDLLDHHRSSFTKDTSLLDLKNKFVTFANHSTANTFAYLHELITEWKNTNAESGQQFSRKEKNLYDELMHLIEHEKIHYPKDKDYLIKALDFHIRPKYAPSETVYTPIIPKKYTLSSRVTSTPNPEVSMPGYTTNTPIQTEIFISSTTTPIFSSMETSILSDTIFTPNLTEISDLCSITERSPSPVTPSTSSQEPLSTKEYIDALGSAMKDNEDEAIRLLSSFYSYKINVNDFHFDKKTIFAYATECQKLKVMKILHEKYKANLNKRYDKRYAPLEIAILKQNDEIIEYLLERGALTDRRQSNGKSPLYFAIDCKNLKIVKLLVRYGAKIDLPGHTGVKHLTPIEYAKKHKCVDIANYLQENIKQPVEQDFSISRTDNTASTSISTEIPKQDNTTLPDQVITTSNSGLFAQSKTYPFNIPPPQKHTPTNPHQYSHKRPMSNNLEDIRLMKIPRTSTMTNVSFVTNSIFCTMSPAPYYDLTSYAQNNINGNMPITFQHTKQ